MKVLVTGAGGFIGSHLVARLLAEGHSTRALMRASTDARRFDPSAVEIVRGDVCNPQDVERAMDGCHLVFHLAVVRGNRDITVGGTTTVARAAARTGVGRLVFPSSTRVYGLSRRGALDERTRLRPDSAHGRFKAAAEQAIRTSLAKTPVAVIARLPLVLGPGGGAWRGVFQAVASGRFRLIGTGDNHCHPADVSDVIDGLLLCGTVRGIEGRTYILAGAEPRRLREIIATLASLLDVTTSRVAFPAPLLRAYGRLNGIAVRTTGRDLPLFERVQLFLQDYRFDLTRARTELGYSPRISIEEMLQRTLDSYRQQGVLPLRAQSDSFGPESLPRPRR
jgi:nucleoside-diphosphate-sugar epimerase